MELFKNSKIFNFIGLSKWLLGASFILILISLYLFFGKGFQVGIDFAGGTLAQLRYEKTAPIEQIRNILENKSEFKGLVVTKYGSDSDVLLKLRQFEGGKNLGENISSYLKPTGNFEIIKLDSVGARVGSELREKGVLSLVIAILAMMAYVSFRYEWRFALAGIFALVHDIIIASASIIIFRIDLNLEVIAALLTLLGYSINDTIIIFDRIRERMLASRNEDVKYVINEAISSTLSRTMLTSLTVFFVVLVLYLFGGKNIVGFSLPMLVGVVVGTYSSLFVAPAMAILFRFNIAKYRSKEFEKQKRAEEKRKLRAQYEGGVV
ncbi:MAG: protein translocase subunit SecF [Helicobacter sp.]|nr:protein translocase subunit SecF [Helicobacter sp.]